MGAKKTPFDDSIKDSPIHLGPDSGGSFCCMLISEIPMSPVYHLKQNANNNSKM